MGDGSLTSKVGNMKALLGIVAGAGASYGIYKLISFRRNKKSVASEAPGAGKADSTLQRGSLLAKVSGLDVVSPRADIASGNAARKYALKIFSQMSIFSKMIPQNILNKKNTRVNLNISKYSHIVCLILPKVCFMGFRKNHSRHTGAKTPEDIAVVSSDKHHSIWKMSDSAHTGKCCSFYCESGLSVMYSCKLMNLLISPKP